MANIILCDIDGTVADNSHRQHFLEGKKDWDGFFSELVNDLPIHSVISLVKNEQAKGKEVIFLTGRPERYRYSTTLWLKNYFNFEFKLLMRKDNDQTNKIIVKEEIFDENFSKDQIDYVIDNDEQLLEMWERKGINIISAAEIINQSSP
tara:strand:- start:99 stop:545 length:447 start_codon:yes stop_codon:yes gene_type:complete